MIRALLRPLPVATVIPVDAYHTAHSDRAVTVERVRPTDVTLVAVHQPLPGDATARLTGRLLCEVRINGELHHYRIDQGDFVLRCPPHWLAPDSYDDVREAGLTVPDASIIPTLEGASA